MRIGIVDADLIGRKSQRFPNLVCMKIAGYHRNEGDEVELITEWKKVLCSGDEYDKIYLSMAFKSTKIPKEVLEVKNLVYGGTGFYYHNAPPLDPEVEHSFPYYDLYKPWVEAMIASGRKRKEFIWYLDFSIGYTTRGCINGCEFCVNRDSKASVRWSRLEEFYDPSRKYICLLDDNVLACKHWREIFEELEATGKKVVYKQGLDERLLTEEKCHYLFNRLKYYGDYMFAFDNIADRDLIVKKLDLIRKYTDSEYIKFYLFCGFNHSKPHTYTEDFWAQDIVDLFERIRILLPYRCYPYVMRYEDYELSPYRGMYVAIANWCNQPKMFKRQSLREFAYAKLEEGNKAVLRYLREYEGKFPAVANKYYDMSWYKYKEGP